MSIADSILPEFDQEMAGTRQTLERIPDDKLDWKAHPKTNTIRWVATHLAQIPEWAIFTLTRDSFDLNPTGGKPYWVPEASSCKEILEKFDKNAADARRAIASTSDEDFLKPWSLLKSGQVLMTLPRIAILRSFVLSHMIHHRAHLLVYLRLNDIPVPGLYGPSGDEQ